MRFITHATWLYVMRSIAIQRSGLNGNDLHCYVSSEPLMCFIGWLRPNCLYTEMFFEIVKHSRAIQVNRTVYIPNLLTLLILISSKLISASEECLR